VPPANSGTGEFALIRRYFSAFARGPHVELGPGDDAALLAVPPGELLVISTDTQVQGVHFPQDSDAARVSYRACAAAVSDLAAMGARPLGMTLALTLPESDENWLSACSRGLAEAVDDFSLPLVGGDTTRGSLSLTITVLGATRAGAALRRDGARPGDRLCVSGTLGDAAAGLALLQGRMDAASPASELLIQRFWRPQPALALGQALSGVASAAIDISDGLLADAGHLSEASGVRIAIDSERIPLSDALSGAVERDQAMAWALAGGDDYALCFTLGPHAALPENCWCIGRVERGSGVSCDFSSGTGAGFEHFA